MTLGLYPELQAFLSAHFVDSDPERDGETTRAFTGSASAEHQRKVLTQLRLFVETDLSVEEVGSEANRWFAEASEARTWLRRILAALEGSQVQDAITVKDSNGTPLGEGDTVQVISEVQ